MLHNDEKPERIGLFETEMSSVYKEIPSYSKIRTYIKKERNEKKIRGNFNLYGKLTYLGA